MPGGQVSHARHPSVPLTEISYMPLGHDEQMPPGHGSHTPGDVSPQPMSCDPAGHVPQALHRVVALTFWYVRAGHAWHTPADEPPQLRRS